MKFNITVNYDEATKPVERDYNLGPCTDANGAIAAALVLHPNWSSMVLTVVREPGDKPRT